MRREDVMALAGRLLLAVIFLASAFGKVTNFDGTVRFMEAAGVPWPRLLCPLAAALEAAGGVCLILGFYTRAGATALAGFLLAATWLFHAGPEQRVHFLKNLAILGGLFQVIAFGSGELSLEGRAARR